MSSEHPILDSLYRTIMVRQDERARSLEDPLKELTIPRETYDRLVDEGKTLCYIKDATCTDTKIAGVLIRRMGDV